MKFMRSPKAISDRGVDFKENEDLCDFDDIDINQLHQLYNRFIPLASIQRGNETKQED